MQQIDVLVRTAALAAAACFAACGSGDHARQLPDAPPLPDAAPDMAVPPDAATGCAAGPVDTRIQIGFDSKNAEWVKTLTWRDSSGTTTPNLATSGGGTGCSTANELFGQVYGAPEGNQPFPIGGNTVSTGTRCGSDMTNTTPAMTCDATPQMPVTTEYHFYGGAQASQVRITRAIGFDATTPVYSGVGVRPYVPRVPAGTFTNVIYPDGAAAMTRTIGVFQCSGDCLTPVGATWNGHWLADVDPRTGLAMIMLRDPSMTSPVQFTVNNDTSSGSNLSSFVLVQPSGGWKAPVTEVEYLCFADLTSWPQAMRDAAALPAGCGP